MRKIEANQELTYRLKVTTEKTKKSKTIKEVWERVFTVCYIGNYKNYHRFQLLTLKLNYTSSVPMPYVYFQKRMATVFDTLSILVNTKGEVVKINNIDALIHKAEQVIEELSMDHSGAYFDQYAIEFKAFLNNSVELRAFLTQDALFGLLFEKAVWNNQILLPLSKDHKQAEEFTEERKVIAIDRFEKSEQESRENEQVGTNTFKGKACVKKHWLCEVSLEHREEFLITEYNLLWIG